ncbi:MAG: BlaI/MecI/CopY family transcriptional regulator [Longimicrobiales bacterium]
MEVTPNPHLSRRERQIMDVVYARGSASVADVLDDLPDPPGYSAVRAMLAKLERKGHLQHEEQGPRYVYVPTRAREEVQGSALHRMMRTFFDGSPTKAVAAILDLSAVDMSEAEIDEMAKLVEQARRRGK